jgi:serine/threonine protein kinase
MRICPGCRSVYSSDARVCPKDGLALIEYSVTFPLPAASPQPAPVPQQTSVLGSDETKVEPGMMVGDYRVEKAIAQGGMGTIYAAIHPLISKRVALKVLSRRFAQDSEQIARFVLEARAVNQIGHHNIVDIFAIGELTDGRKYLVMEYLDGLELNRVLANVGRLRPGEVLPIYEQLCDALAAAHEKGFVHRDLKPENVTILRRHPYPFIKILDFGIAKLRGTEQTAVGTVLGTPEYMAPEQCRAGKIDARVDVYALGVMLYELVTGKKPFYHPDPLRLLTLQTTEEPKPPSTITSISPQLEQIILRTLKKDPSERQQSVRELIHELRKAIPHTLPWTASLDAPVSKASVGDRTRTLPPQDLKAAHSGSSAPPTTPDSLAAASRDAQPSSFSSAPQHDTDRTDLVTTNTNFAAPTVPAPAEDSEAGGSGRLRTAGPDTDSRHHLSHATGHDDGADPGVEYEGARERRALGRSDDSRRANPPTSHRTSARGHARSDRCRAEGVLSARRVRYTAHPATT